MEIFKDWQKWKKTLSGAVNVSEKSGMKDNTIVNLGEKVGDFLENNVEPANPQQKVLRDLWQSGDEKEQKALASMIVKMVDDQ